MLSKIDALTKKYRREIIQPTGGLVLAAGTLQYAISNNFNQDDITKDYVLFCNLPRFLLRESIFPMHNVIIADSAVSFFDFWAIKTINYFRFHPRWIHQFLFDPETIKQYENLTLLESLLLFEIDRAPYSIIRERTPLWKVINDANSKLLPCFVFPFLENLVRSECKNLIRQDGTIIDINSFPTKLKKQYQNRYQRDPQNFQISNIGDELLLFTSTTTNPLKSTIDFTIKEFAKCLNSRSNPYKTFSNTRNSVLHGDIGIQGTMAAKYIIFLIFLSKINATDYNNEFQKIKVRLLKFD